MNNYRAIAMRVLYALLAVIIYYVGISIVEFAFGYGFPMELERYYVFIMLGIFVAIIVKWYMFAGLVSVASIVGHIVNLAINRSQGSQVTMKGGLTEWFMLLLALIAGAIIEFIIHKRRKSKTE